ncbi:response regulator, partial [Paenibacillus sepulcri]|nr:response regulator [Paenibacillus sepulcri]
MYRALIVDDEPDIRLGLQLKVDWNSLNATVAAEAANGAEALEKLQLEEIDIMIADMNMPVMNGVSLLEACSRQFPALKVIVVTGYEDFHYAKAALKNQARDYLLKPVSREELLTALTRVIGELDDERKDEDEQKLVQWRLSQYFKEMKEHFILYIVKEELKRKDDVIERSRRFGLDDWDERRVRFLTAGLRERSVHNDAQLRTPDKFHMPFEMVCREFAQTYPASEQPQVFRDANYPGLMHFILPDDEHGIAVFAAALRACIAEQL